MKIIKQLIEKLKNFTVFFLFLAIQSVRIVAGCWEWRWWKSGRPGRRDSPWNCRRPQSVPSAKSRRTAGRVAATTCCLLMGPVPPTKSAVDFFRRLTVLHGKGRLFSRLLPKVPRLLPLQSQRSNGAFWVSHELCVFGAIETLWSAGTGRLHRQGLREFATAERSRHSSGTRQWAATANTAGNRGWG